MWIRPGVMPIALSPAAGMTMILYVDETWCNAHCTAPSYWYDFDGQGGLPVPTGKGHHLIVSYVGYDGVGVHSKYSSSSFCWNTRSDGYYDEMK